MRRRCIELDEPTMGGSSDVERKELSILLIGDTVFSAGLEVSNDRERGSNFLRSYFFEIGGKF